MALFIRSFFYLMVTGCQDDEKFVLISQIGDKNTTAEMERSIADA